MKLDDIPNYYKEKYETTCPKCGKRWQVRTVHATEAVASQPIYIWCICNDYVELELPVAA